MSSEKDYSVVLQGLLGYWDGKECIMDLYHADYQWSQMEWIGWWFEWKCFNTLHEKYDAEKGPKYGNTTFDALIGGENVIDFKSHIDNGSWAIINDCEAIERCLEEYGKFHLIIAEGLADFDNDGSFNAWHNKLKGGLSDYEKERIRRGAKSRRRKRGFDCHTIRQITFNKESLNRGKKNDTIRYFQKGMRNADGSPRRPKYMIEVDKW